MFPLDNLDHYRILSSMLAPALLMAATGSLLISANNRLARVVDRLRSVLGQWEATATEHRAVLEVQIRRHRARATHVMRACVMLYVSLGCSSAPAWRWPRTPSAASGWAWPRRYWRSPAC